MKISSAKIQGCSLAFLLGITTAITTPSPSYAQRGTVTFSCGTFEGSPATIANHSRRGPVAVIQWRTLAFGPDFTPEVRCQKVSQRFQQTSSNGTFNYIVEGRLNGYPVLCASTTPPADRVIDCPENRLLVTLRFSDDPQAAIKAIAELNRASATAPYQNAGPLIYSRSGRYRGIYLAQLVASAPPALPEDPSYSGSVCLFGVCDYQREPAKIWKIDNLSTAISVYIDHGSNSLAREPKRVGVILGHQNSIYYVITTTGEGDSGKHRILTFDGQEHLASSIQRLEKSNLLILGFVSSHSYFPSDVTISKDFLVKDNIVYIPERVAPSSEKLILTKGQISETFASTYQFRYTNIISSNMRGAPIFDENGYLVGINLGDGFGQDINSILRKMPSNIPIHFPQQ